MDDVVRLLVWNVGDSKTSFEELRERLPAATPPDFWIANEASERLGLVTFGHTPAAAIERAQELIGVEPVVGEEFDVLG